MEELVYKLLGSLHLEPRLQEEMLATGRLKRIRAGDVLIHPKSQALEIPLVLKGLLKVMRQDDHGHEVFLYFLEAGQTCAMSITCCIEGRKSAFHVVAEEDAVLWMVPVAYLDIWVTQYKSFRKYVFASYQSRFEELLTTIDSIAFLKLDERLYKYLLDKKQASGSYVIHKTHQQIAQELNTSRVVVSRLLKQLEKADKIEQYRNRIEIL